MNPQPNRFSFKEVAKQTGASGLKLARKDFRDQAGEALRKGGFGKVETEAILKGTRKLRPEKLKKVFKTLRSERLIKKGREAVTAFVQKEKIRQREGSQETKEAEQRNLRMRLRERMAEEEQTNERMKAALTKVPAGSAAPASAPAPVIPVSPDESVVENTAPSELAAKAEKQDLPIT